MVSTAFGAVRPARFYSAPEVEVCAQDAEQDEGGCQHFARTPTGAREGAVLVGGGAEGQALDLLGRRRWAQVAYDHHHQRREQGDDDAEVLEVDVVYDPEERPLGVAVLVA